MKGIAIVGGGPGEHIPALHRYKEEELTWIGADRGAITLVNEGISPDYAVGDFDSVSKEELEEIKHSSKEFTKHPAEKDETDLEIAVRKALSLEAEVIYFFGVTGGRLDHALTNLQILAPLENQGIKGVVIDKGNWVECKSPGRHEVFNDPDYPNISFIPFTPEVRGLTLGGFYYPLENAYVPWGSTLCVSNKLISEKGTFSFEHGILLLIKSRDVLSESRKS
ncbi:MULTISPECIES: thiamine diphosphokinase [Pontibacillus]|uniref:Thiamine diphosphokinase n=1 Tax=Pontibacillus chungwhensis TaxID=265426 RepID=A0ABY8V2E5_9BACI|nr:MULTISPECIES: thiamine diphosphokinase [Pontibacillus]MCD5322638.1 thiamine diphosphokinase [Pontibacillus sp. HN14]WIF99919.1 thiamine diphosphokinase [Pontibacillus chungwhensis]